MKGRVEQKLAVLLQFVVVAVVPIGAAHGAGDDARPLWFAGDDRRGKRQRGGTATAGE